MKVLVCGGAGYIGAHMCKTLASAGHDVTVFDNLSTGHARAVKWGPLVQGDLLNPDDLKRAFLTGRFDAVMHFSAKSLVGESVQHPQLYFRNNVTGTVNLLDLMCEHGVENFIFSSSAAVYGYPRYTPIDEEHQTCPINPYGRTKLVVEQLLPHYADVFGIRSISLRYFNAAGASPDAKIGEDHQPETHLIPNILSSILARTNHPLKVFGNDYDTTDGTCIRDYVHVDDLCDAHVRALTHLSKGGQSMLLNLGNGNGFSVLEVIRAAEEVTGHSIPYTMSSRRPGDPSTLVASASRARSTLSWQPRYTDLREIIETAWRWHQILAREPTHPRLKQS